MTHYELEVLQGEQQGARTTLAPGAPVTISGAFDADVVLRGADQRIRLTPEGDRLLVDVLAGEVECDGRRLAAGQSASVALATPLALGGTRIGVVRHGDDTAAAPEPQPEPAPQAARPWPRRLAAAGSALAAVSVGVLAFAYSAAPPRPTAAQLAERAEALLRGAGMPKVSVAAAADGTLRVDGYLETAAQRAQAEELLAGQNLRPAWQVWVNEQVAAAVQDVFRTNGVQAQVQAIGPGAVRVSASVADPLVLDGIRSIARRDVPGLASMELHNDPVAPRGPVSIDDAGKRVSSIVPGDPPYVVTVDGTRYFEGALLPTGHRIASIEEHQVVLEINGVKTPLVF